MLERDSDISRPELVRISQMKTPPAQPPGRDSQVCSSLYMFMSAYLFLLLYLNICCMFAFIVFAVYPQTCICIIESI